MPNCDFYALAPDLVGVLDFVFEQPGWELVELSSLPDQELRTFRSAPEVIDGFASFHDVSRALHFQLYAATMGGRVASRRITFKPGAVPGATHRHTSEGWGLIQLYFGQLREGRLSNCHTNHSSERGARNWESTCAATMGPVDAWNWKEVTRISSRLNRFLQRTAVAKLHSRPILPAAAQAQSRGEIQLA